MSGRSRAGNACLAALAGGILGGASPANAVAIHSQEPSSLPLPQLVANLEAVGLVSESQRILRREVDSGGAWAREPLLASLLRSGRAEEALERIEAWGGAERVGFEAPWFAMARIQEALEDRESAAASFVLSIDREPLLSDHAAHRAARVLESLSREEEAIRLYELTGESARNADLVARALWKAATLSMERNDGTRALANLQRIPDPSPIARADLLELEANAKKALGDDDAEEKALRRILEEAPSSAAAVRAVERLEKRGHLGVAEHLAFARIGVSAKSAPLAESHAERALHLLEKHPDPVAEGQARLLLGRALVQRGKLIAARDELARLPLGAAVEDRASAALERARTAWKLDQLDAALAQYDSLAASDAPESIRSRAAWEAAREAKDARRVADAALRLQRFREAYPADDAADDALWHEARLRIQLGESNAAATADSLLSARHPESPFRDESSFWLAKEFARIGRTAEACERALALAAQGDGYWAVRARETFLGASCPAPPAGSDSAWTALQSGPAVLGESAAPALRRAAILARWGLLDEAEAELGAIRRELARDPPALRALALAADSIGVSRGAMSAVAQLRARLGGSILFQSMPATAARLLYPLVQVEHVLRWCDEYGVDPFFVFAVMREESWLDPEAVSRAGARGLLQIMPATGEDLARQTGLEEFERGDLFDPAINIRLGVFYLRRLLDRFDNEPLLVLAAYNAGEKNALRWRADAEGKLDADRTAAEITYTETFDYVQKVLTTREIYRSLYAESLPRLRGILANSAAVD